MSTWNIITSLLSLAIMLGTIIWLIIRAFRNSDDPGGLLRRWIATVPVLGIIAGLVPVMLGSPFVGVPAVALFSIVLSIIWAPVWARIFIKPLTSMFDGGDEELEPQPLYSIAEAKRKRGEPQQALAEVRNQLAGFPNDFTGQLMLAEIYAEDLKDVGAAQKIVEALVAQPGRTPPQIAGALHSLADWELKYSEDPVAAREALEQINRLLPNTHLARAAMQRIAHLPDNKRLADARQTPTIPMHHFQQDLGLRQGAEAPTPVPEDPELQADRLISHLREHPFDADARENLARVYAEQYQRVDLAQGQLDQLISHSGQPAKHVARWLHMSADLHMKFGNDRDAAERALRRIMELFPGSAHAEQASTRIAFLWSENKSHATTAAVKLGHYEKDLGLRKRQQSPPDQG